MQLVLVEALVLTAVHSESNHSPLLAIGCEEGAVGIGSQAWLGPEGLCYPAKQLETLPRRQQGKERSLSDPWQC